MDKEIENKIKKVSDLKSERKDLSSRCDMLNLEIDIANLEIAKSLLEGKVVRRGMMMVKINEVCRAQDVKPWTQEMEFSVRGEKVVFETDDNFYHVSTCNVSKIGSGISVMLGIGEGFEFITMNDGTKAEFVSLEDYENFKKEWMAKSVSDSDVTDRYGNNIKTSRCVVFSHEGVLVEGYVINFDSDNKEFVVIYPMKASDYKKYIKDLVMEKKKISLPASELVVVNRK